MFIAKQMLICYFGAVKSPTSSSNEPIMETHFGLGRLFFALFFLPSIVLFAQNQEIDVIYLKSGKIISGKIVERIPDKTVVIETPDGMEFVDYVDIKRIQKEFVPKIDNVSPLAGDVGSTVSLNGSFPALQPKDAVVFLGSVPAEILQWTKTKIDIRIPVAEQNDYVISVQYGNQKEIARIAFTVKPAELQSSTRVRGQKKPVPQETPDEGYTLNGFWMIIGYMMPRGDIAATEKVTDGFAKKGIGLGYEGRIQLSRNLYLPLNFQVSYLGYNVDELQKLIPVAVSSQGKSYGLIWFTGGLGFAIHLSPTTYLFGSGDYGITMVHRPDTKFGTVSYTNAKATNTFTGGYGYSAGITFSGDFTFGYRFFTAKPKHKVEISYSGSTVTNEVEIEQKTDVGMIYVMFSW